jgi:hypothetical protein
MKKLILTLAIIATYAINLNAAVWTVSNDPDHPMQFSGLQEAIDAVSAGDTLYVSGSTIDYGYITIKKEVHLIGAGYNPAKQASTPSFISGIELDTITDISGASNTSIEGFKIGSFGSTLYAWDTHWVHNIVLRRNYFLSSISITRVDNLLIRNNIIGDYIINNYSRDIIIANNIFIGDRPLRNFHLNSTFVICNNNVFMGNNIPDQNCIASNHLKRFIFNNNIFYGIDIEADQGGASIELCEWNNNISYGLGDITFPITGSNSGANNQEGVDPLFVNCPAFTFDYTYDFHLQTGSPAIGAGTYGTDIGLYGGPAPFVDGGGLVAIPQITRLTIINSMLPKNETLQVDIKAHSQQ